MNLFEKIKKRKQRDNSYLFDDGDELDKIKKPTKKANKEVFDTTGKSAVRDAKKYASGEYPKIGGGDRGTPKSKGSGAFTGGISTKTEIGNEKDFMRRNVAKSGLKIKGTTPIKINVDPKAAKTPTARQSEVAKKTNEFVQRIKKIKGTKTGKPISTGDIGFTAPDRKTKVAKRTTRAVKQGLPDPFDIDTSKASKEVAKDLKVPKKSDFKKLNQRPGGYRAPVSEFGKSVTPSEFRSKQLSASAFRKTQPRDVKLPKSFTDFSKKLKTLKTDVAKTASATPRTVTKKYKPTTTVKQSEVSKKAKDFTKKINQARTKKVTPTTTASAPKTPNVFKRVSKATSGKGVTNSKGIGNKYRKNPELKRARIDADRAASGMGGGGKPPKTPNKPLSSPAPEPNNNSRKIVKQSKYDKVKAGIDARNPTKPGQYTGKPVPLKQREYTSFKNKYLSAKGKKFVENVPKIFKNKTFAKIGKAALKNPYVAAGAAVVGTALAGYGAYRGIKGLLNKPKAASLKTTDLKPGRTVTYGRDDPKGKFKKGDDVRFDALGLGFTKKTGVEKKKPTFQDFQSGRYTLK